MNEMNNWPNPNSLGEPRFPDITRSHFLRYVAEPTGLENAPANVMQDAILTGIWNADKKDWCIHGEYPMIEEVVAGFEYISPCYTEAEMRQARLDTFDVCYDICEEIGDESFSDCESNTAFYCASKIDTRKDKI